MRKNKILIVGASGHGKVIADIAIKMKLWNEVSFLDDNKSLKFVMGLKVIGNTTSILKYSDEYDIFIGIGDNSKRKILHEILKSHGIIIPTLIHPGSIIADNVQIGSGTVVMAGAVVNCCTSIGESCIVNTGSTIDHDNIIDDYVHISPGSHLAGTVKIGTGSWLGIGSIVSNNVTIGKNCNIGAGSVVIKDIHERGTYIGVPVRRI